jgi:hypothetical protein
LAVLGSLEGHVGLTLDLVNKVGEVLGGQRERKGCGEVLVSDVEASEAFVVLGDSDGGEFPLGGGEDLTSGLALHVGMEPQGGGCNTKGLALVVEYEVFLP